MNPEAAPAMGHGDLAAVKVRNSAQREADRFAADVATEILGGPDPAACPLAACCFTEEGVCRTHLDCCPEHDCPWCQRDEEDGTYGY